MKENFDIYYVKGDSDSRIVELSNFDVEKFGKIQNIQGGHSEIINPSNINDQSFVCFKECFYNGSKKKLDKKTSLSNKKFTDKRFISDKEGSKIELVENHVECVFTFDFLEFLGSVDVLANEHPDKEKVVLEDIYVYPLVERYYDLEASKKSVDSKKLVEKFTTSKLLIAGESQSGKTSLCKMLIQELKKKKLIPIYLTDDKNPHEGRIEKRLIEAYNSQYSSDCEFKDISLDKIIPVIDNFHTAKKKEKIITDLSCFPSTVLIVDDLFSLNLS